MIAHQKKKNITETDENRSLITTGAFNPLQDEEDKDLLKYFLTLVKKDFTNLLDGSFQ